MSLAAKGGRLPASTGETLRGAGRRPVGVQTGSKAVSLNLPGGLGWALLSDSGPGRAWAPGDEVREDLSCVWA